MNTAYSPLSALKKIPAEDVDAIFNERETDVIFSSEMPNSSRLTSSPDAKDLFTKTVSVFSLSSLAKAKKERKVKTKIKIKKNKVLFSLLELRKSFPN